MGIEHTPPHDKQSPEQRMEEMIRVHIKMSPLSKELTPSSITIVTGVIIEMQQVKSPEDVFKKAAELDKLKGNKDNNLEINARNNYLAMDGEEKKKLRTLKQRLTQDTARARLQEAYQSSTHYEAWKPIEKAVIICTGIARVLENTILPDKKYL